MDCFGVMLVVNGGREEESREHRKGVSNAFLRGYTKECSRVVTPDARKEGTNKVGSHRQGCAECQTSRFHQHGLVPPIPNTICALNEMCFLFSSI